MTFQCIDLRGVLRENNDGLMAQIQIFLDKQRGLANLRGKVDTGAQGNILPVRLYRQMFPDHVDAAGCPQSGRLQPSDVTLKAYGGSAIPHLGICTIACLENGKRCEADFFVTDTPGLALFGMPLIRGLGLLNVQIDATTSHNGSGSPIDKAAVLREFPECFNGIGELEGTYHITLDPHVTPVINSP